MKMQEKAGERKLRWDEENRLLSSDDNGFVTNYWYDADGERTVKTSGEGEQIYVNSVFAGGRTNTAKFSLYVSPYLVANQGGRYTKHIYIGSQRIVSKLGDFDSSASSRSSGTIMPRSMYPTMVRTTTTTWTARASAATTVRWRRLRLVPLHAPRPATSRMPTHTRKCSSTTIQTIWAAAVTIFSFFNKLNCKMNHYQLSFTLEKSIRRNYEMPHTISIESKEFLRYNLEKNKTISMYFENKKSLYDEMPDNLRGKLIKRKGVIDFMDFTPSCISLVAVVSHKIKQIFERLNVSEDEYVFKKISIKDYDEEFYLLFIPIIPDTEFVYPKCIFKDMFDNGNIKTFNNRAEYYNDSHDFLLKKIALKNIYRDYDLLYPQGCGFYFSERIINAMQHDNIVGYDLVKGGYFYEEMVFF